MHRHRIGNGIRGPTGPDKANDRAGNAAVRETDQSGRRTNQPSRVSRYLVLAPAASVGGRGANVKIGGSISARSGLDEHAPWQCITVYVARFVGLLDGRGTGVAGNHTGVCVRPIGSAALLRYTESGTASDGR